MMAAPIVIFAYRRPQHLKRMLESLMICEEFADSPVIVYVDGPKSASEMSEICQVRQVVRELLGADAEYHFSEINRGLSQSIIDGVSAVIRRYGRAIVVEDDLLLAPNFLNYMNTALNFYQHEEKVFQISGYMFETQELDDQNAAMLLPLTVSWGWATWQRAWKCFDISATGWQHLLSNSALRRKFDIDGVYGYSTMLARQMMGKRDSWAVRWYWSAFQNDALTVFPPQTLVRNLGFDGSGSHGRGFFRNFDHDQAKLTQRNIVFPKAIQVNRSNLITVKNALRKANGGGFGSILDYLRWIVTKNLAKKLVK